MADRLAVKRKRELLAAIRKERGCVDCGTREGLLHFDHRPDTEKLFEPAHGARYSLRNMLAEVAKCDVRCAACHQKRHRTLTPNERVARVRARWQRWYNANRERRAAYGRIYRSRRNEAYNPTELLDTLTDEQAEGLVPA